MDDKKITDYLDKNFDRLIKRSNELTPEDFFRTKWEDCEEVPIYNTYADISFLKRFSQEEKDLYLLKYSLKHLNSLVSYFCKNNNAEEIKNTLVMLTISRWVLYPEEQLCFGFFITYKYHKTFWASKPYVKPYTKQSFYIIELMKKLNLADDYFVYDDHPPVNPELQRVDIGLKKHPNHNLITLDHFVA